MEKDWPVIVRSKKTMMLKMAFFFSWTNLVFPLPLSRYQSFHSDAHCDYQVTTYFSLSLLQGHPSFCHCQHHIFKSPSQIIFSSGAHSFVIEPLGLSHNFSNNVLFYFVFCFFWNNFTLHRIRMNISSYRDEHFPKRKTSPLPAP